MGLRKLAMGEGRYARRARGDDVPVNRPCLPQQRPYLICYPLSFYGLESTRNHNEFPPTHSPPSIIANWPSIHKPIKAK
jgi:hypothetical protein